MTKAHRIKRLKIESAERRRIMQSIAESAKRAETPMTLSGVVTAVSNGIIALSEGLGKTHVKALTYTFLATMGLGINALICDNKNLVIAFNTLVAASVAASVWSRHKSVENEALFYNMYQVAYEGLDFSWLKERFYGYWYPEEPTAPEIPESPICETAIVRPAPRNFGISWGDIMSITAVKTAIRYCALDKLLEMTHSYLPDGCAKTTHLSVVRLVSKYAEESFKLARHSSDFTKDDATDRKLLLLAMFKGLFIQTTAVGLEVLFDSYLPIPDLKGFGHYVVGGLCATASAGLYHLGGIAIMKCYGAYEVTMQNLKWFAVDSVSHGMDVTSFATAESASSVVVKMGMDVEKHVLIGIVASASKDAIIGTVKGIGGDVASLVRI